MKEDILRQAAGFFGVTSEDLTLAKGGNCSEVFFVQKGMDEFVLRIIPPDEDFTLQSVTAIQTWVSWLAEHGCPVARPLFAEDGELVKAVEDEDGLYLINAVKKAAGVRAETLPVSGWTDEIIRSVGRAAGKMHRLSAEYQPDDKELLRPEWDQIGTNYSLETLPPSDQEVLERYQGYYEIAETFSRSDAAYGMIHADYHGGNFFIDPQTARVTLFDFDDCCRGWFAMDLSLSLFDALVLFDGADKSGFAERFMREMLLGYREEFEIESVWIENIPVFLKLLEMGIYSQVCQYYDPADTQSYIGKFMPGRKQRILDDVPYINLDFSKF